SAGPGFPGARLAARRLLAANRLLAVALAPALLDQLLQLLHELADVLERAVDRREAHVGDGIEAVQLTHHRLADDRALQLALAAPLQAALDAFDDRLDLLHRDRPLLARPLQPGDDLHAVEGLAPAVLLHHHRQRVFGALVGGEAAMALEALAPPA